MNEKELAEIEARAEAATPGPWEFDQKNIGYAHHRSHYGLLTNASRDTKDYWLSINVDYGMEHNADFIAHARQDVPALVAEVRRMSGENERLLATIQDTCTWTEDDEFDSYLWDTECGETVVFEDGTPKENGYRHCHYCGKNIIFAMNGGA